MNNTHELPGSLPKILRKYYHCQICGAPVPAPMRIENKDKNVWDCEACGLYRMTGRADGRLRRMVEMDSGIRARLVKWLAEQRLCPEITLETIEYCELKGEDDPG